MRSVSSYLVLAALGLAALAGCSSEAAPKGSSGVSGGVPKTPDSAQITTPEPGETSSAVAPASIEDALHSHAVGGSVSGLSGSLRLRLAGSSDELVVKADGRFELGPVLRGTPFKVIIGAQPAEQLCTVVKGDGTMGDAAVTDVAVTCVHAYLLGGTVTGASGPVLLANGDAAPFAVPSNGPFTSPLRVAAGKPYDVRVITPPPGQACAVTAHATGTATADVTAVAVRCFTPYATCKALHAAVPDAPSGVYPIKPNGTSLQVYCDMVNDGGGWTRVVNLRPDTSYQADQIDAFGDVSVANSSSKLDDATINAMSTVGYFRFDCGTWNGFLKTDTGAWSSLRSNGLTWSSDATRTGDFSCSATRDGYVFGATDGACGGGLAYVSYDIGLEGGGCYSEADGWYQFGRLWVK